MEKLTHPSASLAITSSAKPNTARSSTEVEAVQPPQFDLRKIPLHADRRAGLTIGSANDPSELEADRVAERVMGSRPGGFAISSGGPQISRACSCCGCEGEDELQRAPDGTPAAARAPAIVHEVMRTPGRPLET